MNEDEAFIRAIVDNPGDDLPRLVYADWLDDRGDPRGPYLRAEAEWAKPWRTGVCPADKPELRALAAGLDPVWVARISRPPAGVCLEHVRLKEVGPQLSPDDIISFEAKHGVALPSQYAAFMLNWNGGTFWPFRFPTLVGVGGRRLPIYVPGISPLDCNRMLSLPMAPSSSMLVIRDDVYTTYLLLGLAGEIAGGVYFHDMYYNYEYFGDHGPVCLAPSLAELLHQLKAPAGLLQEN